MPDDEWPASLNSLPLWKDRIVDDGRRQLVFEYRDLGDEWLEIERQRQEERPEAAEPRGFSWTRFVIHALIGIMVTGFASGVTEVLFGGRSLTINGSTTTFPTGDFWFVLWAILAAVYLVLAAVLEYVASRGRSA